MQEGGIKRRAGAVAKLGEEGGILTFFYDECFVLKIKCKF